jgi:hypothetical protein
MRILFIFILCFHGFCHVSFGQTAATIKNLYEIQNHARIGDKNALRDLATFLDHPRLKDLARQSLYELTLFTNAEIDLSQPTTKQVFLDFFYTHREAIRYSQLLNIFYITPIEQQKINLSTENTHQEAIADRSEALMKAIYQLNDNISKNYWSGAEKNIATIADLKLKEGYEVLLNIAEKMPWRTQKKGIAAPFSFIKTLCTALKPYDQVATVRALLNLSKNKYIAPKEVLPTISQITNYAILGNAPQTIDAYLKVLDSLETLNALRNSGYDQQFSIKKQFFYEEVDYFAMVMMLSSTRPWSRYNAIKDLAATHHPRSLYYLAAQSYRERLFQPDEDFYMEWIKRLTQTTIQAADKREYLRFWASHYDNFEWDDITNTFLLKEERAKRMDTNDRLFRRLNSENDSVAMESFRKLTEVAPLLVQNLSEKYKNLLRNYRVSLPPIRRPYLENLAEWTFFCRKNDINYQLSPVLKAYCADLLTDLSPKKRYALENKIIATLTEADITALEYWACLQVQHREANFSMGRIVHYFYVKNAENIFQNHNSLLLYLKKTALLERIGAYGVARTYIERLAKASKKIKKALMEMQMTVADADIRALNAQLLVNDGKNPRIVTDIVTDIMLVLQAQEGENTEKRLEKIAQKANITAVPQLVKLMQAHFSVSDSTLGIANASALVLNSIYHTANWANMHLQPTDWLAHWQKDSLNFRDWGKEFYAAQQKILKKNNLSLSAEALNAFAASPYFEANDKIILLKSISKNIDSTTVGTLQFPFKLVVKNDLSVFKNINFSYKTLDDVPKWFQVAGYEPILLNFLMDKSKKFDNNELGTFVNAIFRMDWLVQYLRSGNSQPAQIEYLRKALQVYLQENDDITEYEEQITMLNLAQLNQLGASTEVQIHAITSSELDENLKDKILGELLARLEYPEIATIAKQFPLEKMPILMQKLQQDFGIPIFDLEKTAARDTLVARHARLSPFQLYKTYLAEFGLHLADEAENLDIAQICTVLNDDLTMPFSDESAEVRSWHVYGVVKLLEAKFNTTLGFHAKLNENQTFYFYSPAKRVAAWKDFLMKKRK